MMKCYCYLISVASQDMLTQVVNEDGQTVWRCLLCGKDFQLKSNGRRHIEQIHYETPNLECEICGKVLKNKNSYQKHISIIHGVKKRSLQKLH